MASDQQVLEALCGRLERPVRSCGSHRTSTDLCKVRLTGSTRSSFSSSEFCGNCSL